VAQTRLVGAAVTLAALAVIVLGIVKPNPFASYETVRAQFSSAAGIGVVGQEVRIAGANVGSIASIARQGGHALLTLHLDKSVGTIHDDASASLRPHLAFEGTAYVDLSPGSASAPPLRGGMIPLGRTHVYVPVDEALRVFTPPTRAALKATVRELRPTLTGAGSAGLQATLHGAPALVRTLAPAARAAAGPHETELAGALSGLSATVSALASRQAELVPLTRAAAGTFAALDPGVSGPGSGGPLGRTLAALPPALSQLDTGGRALDGIVARLDPLAHGLLGGLRALAPTLSDAMPLVRALGPALTNATPLVGDLRAALHAGAGAAPGTVTVLHELQPTLTMLQGSLLPALEAPTKKLGIPAYLSFINLFEGGGGASAPFQSGNEPGAMGAGHFMRFGFRFLTGIGLPLPPCTLLADVNAKLAATLEAAGVCTPP
jgi:ABC-type transporter Mla subunit MlaD